MCAHTIGKMEKSLCKVVKKQYPFTRFPILSVKQTTVYGIERLPLPPGVKENLKSYALTNYSTLLRHPGGAPQYKSLKKRHKFRAKTLQTPADAAKTDCASVGRRSCVIS